MKEYSCISHVTVGDPAKTVLTPANKEHALPEAVVQQLNAMIEGDAAVQVFFFFFASVFSIILSLSFFSLFSLFSSR